MMHLDRGGFMKQYRDMQRIATLVILTLTIFVGTIVYFNSRISRLEKNVLQLQSRLGIDTKLTLKLTEEKLSSLPKAALKSEVINKTWGELPPAANKRRSRYRATTYRVLPQAPWVESGKLGKTEEKQNVSEDVSHDYNPSGNETPAWLGSNSNP